MFPYAFQRAERGQINLQPDTEDAHQGNVENKYKVSLMLLSSWNKAAYRRPGTKRSEGQFLLYESLWVFAIRLLIF